MAGVSGLDYDSTMGHLAILPDPTLVADDIRADSAVLTIRSRSGCPSAPCPLCRTHSSRVQSRYVRTLTDLPAYGLVVHIELTVRRFVCLCSDCPRKIFAERFAPATSPHSPYTARLAGLLCLLGLAVGGEPGARLAGRLALPASPDTLLRKARAAAKGQSVGTPRQLGVDDFALRRGQRYGTILVDLEKHRPIDLIDGRTAEGLGAWLDDHAGIELLTRDRAPAYAQAATEHAPDAVQVADRFHLTKNAAETVERVLARHPKELKAAALACHSAYAESSRPATTLDQMPATTRSGSALAGPDPSTNDAHAGEGASRSKMRKDDERAARRQRRVDRYTDVRELDKKGFTQRAIARRFGMSRKTVRRFLRESEFPERAATRRRSEYERYLPYLRKRWDEGCHNCTQLWREIRELGYQGQAVRLRAALATWRDPEARPRGRTGCGDAVQSGPSSEVPSPRRAAWFLLKPEKLEPDEERFRRVLLEICGPAAKAERLGCEFLGLVRTRNAAGLDDWLTRAKLSGVGEFKSFAQGIERDKAAVVAALTLEASNGQVEGQVTRLKLIKRMMYGRGKLDLLCARVVHGP